MGIVSTAISSGQQARAANRMMRFQEKTFRNRYQWQMEDMRKAGLNPILAAGQSPGNVGQGAMAKPQIDISDTPIASAKAAKAAAVNQAELLGAQARGAKAGATIAEASVPFKILEERIKSDVAAEMYSAYSGFKDAYDSGKDWLDKLLGDEPTSAQETKDEKPGPWKPKDTQGRIPLELLLEPGSQRISDEEAERILRRMRKNQ